MREETIVVSGVGMATPLGASREITWSRLVSGETGIRSGKHGFEARIYDFSPNGARSRMGDFAILAAGEALRHGGFDLAEVYGKNIGCAVSQSKPLLSCRPGTLLGRGPGVLRETPVSRLKTCRDDDTAFDAELLLSSFFGWSSETVVRREFGLEGPSGNLVAACATGIASIELGAHWIRSGQCEMALAGASESSLDEFYRSGFAQMGVLADCCRPFDKNRAGFVMGEGAAVLLLESARSARERGHAPLVVLNHVRLQQSSSDSLRFDPDGTAVARLISAALTLNARPDYINAHGTGTRFNDAAETKGIKKALGKSAGSIPVSSTKAATGHLLGAAGAVEAAFCVLALRDQIVPPTLNLTEPDPECDLDYVPNRARKVSLRSTLSLSYGFGGQMGAVAFGRC